MALLTEEQHHSGWLLATFRAMMTSPVMLGSLAGFGFLATGAELPPAMDQVMTSIVSAAPFVALFVIGGSILEFRISRSGPRVLAAVVGKPVLNPLCVGALFRLRPISGSPMTS